MAFRWGDLIEETHQLVVVSGKLFNSAMGKTQLWFMAAQKAAHGFLTYLEHSRTVRFFRNLRYFVKPRGLVKIASNMGAVGVRFSYILGALTVKIFVALISWGAQHELAWFTRFYHATYWFNYSIRLKGGPTRRYRGTVIHRRIWCMMWSVEVPGRVWQSTGNPPRFRGAERVPAAAQVEDTKSGWWFGTFFIFTNSWDDDPIWLSYFSEGLKPPTRNVWFSLYMGHLNPFDRSFTAPIKIEVVSRAMLVYRRVCVDAPKHLRVTALHAGIAVKGVSTVFLIFLLTWHSLSIALGKSADYPWHILCISNILWNIFISWKRSLRYP